MGGYTMTEDNPYCRISPDILESYVRQILEEVGVPQKSATIIGTALVQADLRGVDSHGVARLEAYVEKFEGGGFNPDPAVATDRVSPALAMVDGDDGPGQIAATVGIETAVEIASETGFGASLVSNSNHFGTAAYYTKQAAENDCIGIAMTNVGPDVVPYGGTEARLGTNPIAFSIPTNRGFSITLDMATSVVAMGKIDHVAAAENKKIPRDWAVSEDGTPTTDPHSVSALRPVGGPKGYGLAIVVDVLSGLLTGARTSPDIGPLYSAPDEPMGLGHFLAAVDVSTVMDPDEFRTNVDAYIDQIKNTPTRDGVDEVLVPGEPEAKIRRENERKGVPLSEPTVTSLDALGDRYGIQLPE